MLREHHTMPFLAVAAGIATFSLMDALMKVASIAVGAYSAMLLRSLFGAALMFPLWRAGGGRWPDRGALWLHALRGAISAVMATTFFYALVRLPLAEAIALSFIAPLIALYLAAAMLKEQIGRGAVAASLFGFAGVLVIASARIGATAYTSDIGWGIAAVLFSAVLYAINLILQRKQAQIATPREVALFQMGFSGLFLLLAAPWLLVIPGWQTAVAVLASAALAAGSLMLVSWGYGRAEAQALLPIEYSAFIWAALLGLVMFDEVVTVATVAGAALIVSGCWIAARQTKPGPTEVTAL